MFSKIICCVSVVLALFFSAFTANAQVSITTTAVAINENFDSFPGGSGDIPFTSNITLAGWYCSFPAYRVSNGSNTVGSGGGTAGLVYNFGISGNSDRALGSIGANSTGNIRYGLRLRNDTGLPISRIFVRFYGEQWRNGSNEAVHSLTFDYRIAPTADDISAKGFVPVTALTFNGPVTGTPGGPVNGNLEANRVLREATFDLDIPIGEEIMLRWTDINDAVNDHGLAIDDLTIVPYTNVTAANASISGSVLTSSGIGIKNALLTVSGGDLKTPITIQTGAFGTYLIDGLTAGQSYIVTVASKRHWFVDASRLITVDDSVSGYNFVAGN